MTERVQFLSLEEFRFSECLLGKSSVLAVTQLPLILRLDNPVLVNCWLLNGIYSDLRYINRHNLLDSVF